MCCFASKEAAGDLGDQVEPFLCVHMKCHRNFLGRLRQLLIFECVWLFLLEGNKFCNFCEGLDMEGACSAYDNWDNFDVGVECTMSL